MYPLASIRLYSYWRSSSAWRVRIALGYKRIAHQIVPVHLLREGGEQYRPEFTRINPMAQVPTLEVGTGASPFLLTQSMAILEYLEERYPDPSLLPAELLARARVRQLSELVNSGIQPYQNLKLAQKMRDRSVDPIPLVRQLIFDGLSALEALAVGSAGRFLVGDTPTLADVFLVPQLYAARRLEVEVTEFSLLCRVEAACQAVEGFRAARPEVQPDWENPAP